MNEWQYQEFWLRSVNDTLFAMRKAMRNGTYQKSLEMQQVKQSGLVSELLQAISAQSLQISKSIGDSKTQELETEV